MKTWLTKTKNYLTFFWTLFSAGVQWVGYVNCHRITKVKYTLKNIFTKQNLLSDSKNESKSKHYQFWNSSFKRLDLPCPQYQQTRRFLIQKFYLTKEHWRTVDINFSRNMSPQSKTHVVIVDLHQSYSLKGRGIFWVLQFNL